jgi:hypothetical protein
MERFLLQDLDAWKASPARMPLLLHGARQVGKTWLLQEFGRTRYENVAYVSFDTSLALREQFALDYDVARLFKALQVATRQEINPGSTLVILDEIQECPQAITALKYFCEQAREYHVVAAGSLLGITLHQGTGFPVGKVDLLNLYPLNFREFLDAVGERFLREQLDAEPPATMAPYAPHLEDLLKTYYVVGGMPAAVSAYVAAGNLQEVRRVQEQLLYGYERDMSKHLELRETGFTLAAWRSIPAHLGQENKRFVFGHIQEGARAKDYRAAIDWLTQAGLALKVPRVSKPGLTLAAYANESIFKLFLLDVGLLGAMSGLDPAVVLEGNRSFTEFKGALTEQFVCQELVAAGCTPYYWAAENSSGEIDFLVARGGAVYPIEVKAQENLRAKSLRAFAAKHDGMRCVRLSLSGYRDEGWMRNYPLFYAGLPACWWR